MSQVLFPFVGFVLALRIQGNIAVLRAVGNIHRNQRDLSKTTAAMSSGLRIHETSVDAAGHAVAEKMSAKVGALQQSIRNTIDGQNFIGKVENTTNTIVDIVKKMREVATASAGDTLSASAQATATEQYYSLYQEIQRVALSEEHSSKFLNLNVQIGDKNDDDNKVSIKTTALHPFNLGLLMTSVSSPTKAQQALDRLDLALDTLNNYRAEFGATATRLGHIQNNLETYVSNMKGARSVIRDADYAQETATLTKKQITQQTSLAVLAQANQIGASALELIGR